MELIFENKYYMIFGIVVVWMHSFLFIWLECMVIKGPEGTGPEGTMELGA
jgi:hypothetical protein